MSDTSRSAIFRSGPVDAFAALEQAARLTGMQHLSADSEKGVIVFSAGLTVLTFGEKVTARIEQVSVDTVRVTLSSNLRFGLVGRGRAGAGRDRMFDALTGILPSAQ